MESSIQQASGSSGRTKPQRKAVREPGPKCSTGQPPRQRPQPTRHSGPHLVGGGHGTGQPHSLTGSSDPFTFQRSSDSPCNSSWLSAFGDAFQMHTVSPLKLACADQGCSPCNPRQFLVKHTVGLNPFFQEGLSEGPGLGPTCMVLA